MPLIIGLANLLTTKYHACMITDRLAPELIDRLFVVRDAVKNLTKGVLKELDLTEPLADVIWHLDPTTGPLTMRQIADRLHCDPSTVTFLIDRLEERSLVERRAHPTDRRAKMIALTTHGAAHRERLVQVVVEQSPLSALSADEMRHLHNLLGKVANGA